MASTPEETAHPGTTTPTTEGARRPPGPGPSPDGRADGMVTVAAFDFDGTLVAGDSLMAFLRRACGTEATVRALTAQVRPVAGSLARSGHPDRDAAKARILAALLAGRELANLVPVAEAYAAHLVRKVRPHMLARLARHRGAGHRTVIVSASPELYLGPVGRLLDVDTVLATRLEVGPDGRLTGALEGSNCRGPEKAARLRAWLDGTPTWLHAYGDSRGDTDLLAMADTPVWVGRRPRP